MARSRNKELSLGRWYDIMMLVLSVYVMIQLMVEIVLPLNPAVHNVLLWVDFGICVVFLIDWFVFFFASKEKKRYLKSRIFDLAASIPFTQFLRPLRLLRVVRLARTLRLVRGLKGAVPLARTLLANPARSAMTIYGILTGIIFFYCSVGLYNFEKGLNTDINSFADVLWMSFTTLTSVGYGDIYPVTGAGRIMAVVLVATGMGLFSLITAEFATVILQYVRQPETKDSE